MNGNGGIEIRERERQRERQRERDESIEFWRIRGGGFPVVSPGPFSSPPPAHLSD